MLKPLWKHIELLSDINTLIIQWGHFAENSNPMTLPLSYSNNSYVVTANAHDVPGWALACTIRNRTTSNFEIVQINHGGVYNYAQSLWISIGY